MKLINCHTTISAGAVQVVKNDGDRYTTEWIAGYAKGPPVMINLEHVQMVKESPRQTENGLQICTEFIFGKEQTFTVWETMAEVNAMADPVQLTPAFLSEMTVA